MTYVFLVALLSRHIILVLTSFKGLFGGCDLALGLRLDLGLVLS